MSEREKVQRLARRVFEQSQHFGWKKLTLRQAENKVKKIANESDNRKKRQK